MNTAVSHPLHTLVECYDMNQHSFASILHTEAIKILEWIGERGERIGDMSVYDLRSYNQAMIDLVEALQMTEQLSIRKLDMLQLFYSNQYDDNEEIYHVYQNKDTKESSITIDEALGNWLLAVIVLCKGIFQRLKKIQMQDRMVLTYQSMRMITDVYQLHELVSKNKLNRSMRLYVDKNMPEWHYPAKGKMKIWLTSLKDIIQYWPELDGRLYEIISKNIDELKKYYEPPVIEPILKKSNEPKPFIIDGKRHRPPLMKHKGVTIILRQ